MKQKRKIIAYVATSADGFIARPDGDVAWLDRPEPPGGYGMKAFYKTVDTVVLGRKTWDVGRKHGQPTFPGVKNYVFSRRTRLPQTPGIEVVKGDVGRFARKLRGAGEVRLHYAVPRQKARKTRKRR